MAKYRKKPVIIEAEQLTVEMCQKNTGLSNPFRVGHRTRYINYYTSITILTAQ
ncbi:hypothetical protein JNUCC42_04320 [Brevibacterium sp. JNUCC-42]|nr:hypothetical protein JNUCC42_04320 [Brevibacterium sp. JNUCC-42]